MMKIFSAMFFAVCLIGTWYVINSRPSVAYETHVDMEATLVQVITQHLSQEKPNAREFSILSLKSQLQSPENVRIYFQYQFLEPDKNGTWVKVQRSGAADLMKAAAQEKEQPEVWQLRQNRLITKEGLIYEEDELAIPGTPDTPEEVERKAREASTGAVSPTPSATPEPTPTPSH